MSTCLAIRHLAFEDLGSFAPLLRRHGFTVAYRDAGVDNFAARDLLDADLLVVLGGPIGVNDARAYPFLSQEIRLIEQRLAAHRPVLGICLGAQVMAKALGARVYKGRRKELGWGPISLTPAGEVSPLAALAPRTQVLHWHGDTFDLPKGATLLASTKLCAHQAFAWHRHALALQFHIEVTALSLERWFIGNTLEIATTRGVDVASLRRATRRFAPALEERAPRVLRAWLDQVGL